MSSYRIVGYKEPKTVRVENTIYWNVEASAKFEYKGYEISFSTIGIHSGGCRNPVAVFANYVDNTKITIGEFNDVEDAINWINGDDTVTDYRGNPITRN